MPSSFQIAAYIERGGRNAASWPDMHLLLLMAVVLVALVVLSVVICFCYGLNSASCMAAFKLNSAAHSVAGLYNGYADAVSSNSGRNSSAVGAAPLERNSSQAEQGSYSSTIELYDSTWLIKEPPPPPPPLCRPPKSGCRPFDVKRDTKVPRWYVGDVCEGDVVHGEVILEKLDCSSRSASILLPAPENSMNGALPCLRFDSVAASLPSVLKAGSWDRRRSFSLYSDEDGAERFRLEMRSCSLLEESSCRQQVSPIGS